MSAEARAELATLAAGLTPEQVQTMLGWARMLRRRQDEPPRSLQDGEQSVGALGDALGITSQERKPGRARMRLAVDPAWANPNGVLHGGVIYTLIDYSMGSAVSAGLPAGQYCTSIDVRVSYLAPVREGTLTVDTQVVKQGRTIAFLESKVTGDDGRLIATGSGSMFIFAPQE